MSANFDVDLSDRRNSAKASKARGEGHSDLFGTHVEAKPRQNTEMDGGCGLEKVSENGENYRSSQKIIADENEVTHKPHGQGVYSSPKAIDDENVTPAPVQNGSSKERVHVPPGGYSTGFW